jgi:hypothetical protein
MKTENIDKLKAIKENIELTDTAMKKYLGQIHGKMAENNFGKY